jgi:hypothetical protein
LGIWEILGAGEKVERFRLVCIVILEMSDVEIRDFDVGDVKVSERLGDVLVTVSVARNDASGSEYDRRKYGEN